MLTNLPRRPDRSTVMTSQVHIKPAHDNRHGRVRPRGNKKQRHVHDVHILVNIQQDGEAADAQENRQDGKQETMSHPVRHDSHDHSYEKRASPGWDGSELSFNRSVMVCRDDGRRKVGVSVGGDDQPKIHEGAEPDLGVGEDRLDIAKGDLALGGVFALVGFEAGLDVGAFVLSEPFLEGNGC